MRTFLRGGVVVCAVGILIGWVFFVRAAFGGVPTGPDVLGMPNSPGRPPTGAILVAVLFVGLAISAANAAVRDVPIVVLLTGGLSLVPMGLYLSLFAGAGRMIALCDLGIVAFGVALLVTGAERPPRGSSPPSSP